MVWWQGLEIRWSKSTKIQFDRRNKFKEPIKHQNDYMIIANRDFILEKYLRDWITEFSPKNDKYVR